MKDRKYQELMSKQEDMVEWSKFSEEAMYEKMERVRLQHNYSCKEFSILLGYAPYTYSSIVKYKRVKMPVGMFLRFCFLFGYDISQVVSDSSSQSDLDKATYEIAAILSSLSPEGIRDVSNALVDVNKNRNISTVIFRRLNIALRKLRELLEKQEEE